VDLMKNKITNYSFFLIAVSIAGCATFPKDMVNPITMNDQNIHSLNGNYLFFEINRSPLTDSTSFSYSESDIGFHHTIFDEIDSRFFAKSIKIDSSKSYSFDLNVLNTKRLELNYLENETVIKRHTVRYSIKEDGYLYLKKRNFKIKGIPYFFGEFNVKKNRMTLNKENNLIFESSEFSSGGVALLMVYPLGKAKYRKTYERIK
jgi:hypothetical protein